MWNALISYCLIVLDKISNTRLDRIGNIGHPCLICDLTGNASSFSPVSIITAVGLWHGLYYV